MCHNIVTTSIHCANISHREYQKVRCPKFWLADWQEAARCKKQRDLAIELADECQLCQEYGPAVKVEPWEPDPEVSSERDNATDQESSSSDSWLYGDSSDSDEEDVNRSEFEAEDSTVTDGEDHATYVDKAIPHRQADGSPEK